MANYLDNIDVIDANNIAHNVKLQDSDTLALVTSLNNKVANVKIQNVRDFGATGNGVSDDTQSIIDAFNAGDVIYFPHGNYLFNGSINISDKTIIGCGISDNIIPINHGSNILITQTTNTPFKFGSNVTMIGMGFYYPNQDGSTPNPIVYPPTITYNTSTEIIIRDCSFYNSYIAISNSDNSSASGRFNIDSCYIYGIHRGIVINNMYDSVHITNCFISAGVFQDITITGNAYLEKYTVVYGIAIQLTDHVDDLKINNNIIWGYNQAIQLDTDSEVDMLKILATHIDGCPIGIVFNSGGTLNNTIISNCNFMQSNTSFYNGTYGPCIIINKTGTTSLLINNNIFQVVGAAFEVYSNTPYYISFCNNDVHSQNAYALICRVAQFIIANNLISTSGDTNAAGILALSGTYYNVNGNNFMSPCTVDISNCYMIVLTGNAYTSSGTPYRASSVNVRGSGNSFDIS